jgi:hypothetical protein
MPGHPVAQVTLPFTQFGRHPVDVRNDKLSQKALALPLLVERIAYRPRSPAFVANDMMIVVMCSFGVLVHN